MKLLDADADEVDKIDDERLTKLYAYAKLCRAAKRKGLPLPPQPDWLRRPNAFETEQEDESFQATIKPKNREDERFHLDGINLSGLTIPPVEFSKVSLAGAIFDGCTFLDPNYITQFSQCNLKGASFKNCIIRNVVILKCNIEGVDFEGAKIENLGLPLPGSRSSNTGALKNLFLLSTDQSRENNKLIQLRPVFRLREGNIPYIDVVGIEIDTFDGLV